MTVLFECDEWRYSHGTCHFSLTGYKIANAQNEVGPANSNNTHSQPPPPPAQYLNCRVNVWEKYVWRCLYIASTMIENDCRM